MKQESAIRDHLRNLRTIIKTPYKMSSDGSLCDDCRMTKLLSIASADLLEWVLDENQDSEKRCENIAEAAAQSRMEGVP